MKPILSSLQTTIGTFRDKESSLLNIYQKKLPDLLHKIRKMKLSIPIYLTLLLDNFILSSLEIRLRELDFRLRDTIASWHKLKID